MARKSNKTAHVLNLLAGNEPKKDDVEESRETAGTTEPETKTTDTPTAPAPSVAVIDTTEADPVADLIQNKLMEEFGDPDATLKEEPQEPSSAQPETASAQPEPILEPEPEPVPQPEPAPQPQPTPSNDTQPAPQPQPTAEEAPAREPEPDYVFVNVMERIVRDKIIYFMRQFDVCTCDRCKEDTIALTLNGILPKYQVMDRHAVDPLLSFYTNRYISDVTVEATKACMEVKEHPRH